MIEQKLQVRSEDVLGRLAADQMDEGGSQCVQVGSGIDRAAELLGRHVSKGADQRRAMGHALHGASGAEVDQRECAVVTAEDVRRLDVAVHDAALVQVAQDGQELARDDARFGLVDADSAGEGFAVDQLLREIEAQGWTIAFAKGVDQARDLWVRDRPQEPRFALECVELLGRRDESEDHLLERDHPGGSFGAVGPAVRRLRQHGQHAERSGTRGSTAPAAAISGQWSRARWTGRGVHSTIMTPGLIGTSLWPMSAHPTGMSRLEEFAPAYEFNEVHRIRIRAPRIRIYRSFKEVTAGEITLFRTLTWIRRFGRAGPEGILNAPSHEPLLDVATRTGFLLLAEDPEREIVVGTVVIAPRGVKKPSTPEQFKELVAPGVAKAVMNFQIDDAGDGAWLVSTETRVHATDASARRRFARYWTVIRPGSGFIRRMWLRAIKRRAVQLIAVT